MVIGTNGVQFAVIIRGRPILLITCMITDRIERYEVLSPINHNRYNFRKKKQIHFGETMPTVKNTYILEIPHFFRISTCCYGYCNQICAL